MPAVATRSLHSSPAFLVRSVDMGEADRRITFFTRDAGVVVTPVEPAPARGALERVSGRGDDDPFHQGVEIDPLVAREERGDLAEHLRDLEVIGRKDPKKETKDFKDRQLDMALEYLRSQIKAAGPGSEKKGG